MIKIGIVGLGYVGQAVAAAYKNRAELICVDIDPAKSTHNFPDLFKTDAVFICVPSPAKSNGACDASILADTVKMLMPYNNLIISKVTATPDIYAKLACDNLVHIPEFLTANNNIQDYINETSCIIGGQDRDFMQQALDIAKIGQTKLRSGYMCSIKEAAFTKYVENCFLATKVVFMNEMSQVAAKDNISWTQVAAMLQKDPRVGLSHCQVPGPDGKLGFGGHCFPKDTAAFLHYARSLEQSATLLTQAVEINYRIRNEIC